VENYKYVKRLDEISRKDFPLAGGKGSNLGEMIRAGLPVPEGFVILTSAYKRFVVQNNIQESIENILGKIDSDDVDNFVLQPDSYHARVWACYAPCALLY
jgi:pyruvate,water dikinase